MEETEKLTDQTIKTTAENGQKRSMLTNPTVRVAAKLEAGPFLPTMS